MKVLFSITHYELVDVLNECLVSLKKSINYAKENINDFEYIILIIANSKIKKNTIIEDKKIKIIQNNNNHGFTKSCNQAFNYSIVKKFNETVIINQDTIFKEETVYNVLNIRNKIDNKISVLSPVQIDAKNKLDFKTTKKLKKKLNSNYDFVEVSFVNAACWFINNEVIKKIGGMNEIFFHFGSDDDYAYRLKKAGGKIFLINSSKIIHLRSFYKKNFNETYSDMQTVSLFTANAYLRVLINKNLLLALFLLIFKPMIFFLIGRLSFNNFLKIIKLRNIKNLIELNKTKNNLYLEINE